MTRPTCTHSGIPVVGDIPFGTHFCQFFRTKQDLIDTLVPYFTTGLRNNELCLWVTSEPLDAVEATELMHAAMPDFGDYLASGQIQIHNYLDWYLRSGRGPDQALQAWLDWERLALERGYSGLRLTGNTAWLEVSGWDEFVAYETAVNETFGRFRIVGLCTYSLEKCRAEDVIDVCRNHQFALTRRRGEWEVIESASLKIAKTDLEKLNQELEGRVTVRTAELEESLRSRDEFLAMLAHELRNPLAPIRNAAQVIRLLDHGDSHLSRARDVIDRQVGQLARLVDDLLDVSRVTRGKIELHREEVDLAMVVAQAVETSRPLIDSRRHTLTVTLPPEQIRLRADRVRLAQVLANLLNNAAKYMDEAGRIAVTAALREGGIEIRVKDEGVGIAPEMLPRIFDLFTQADRSLARSEGGLGIGLALVRSLVALHEGTVQAFSDGPGRGSEFVVSLPCDSVERRPERGAEAPEAVGPGRGRKVLVVDDNVDSADTLATVLELAGYRVWTAYDGEGALAMAEVHRPGVVLLDIGLPKLDGYEVARRLRQDPLNEDLLLIAVTGYGKEEDRSRGVEAGFDDHLIKPVDLARLRTILAPAAGSGTWMARH